jgi:GGDEF domain-containing protein/sensor domain CHASE-containing protein
LGELVRVGRTLVSERIGRGLIGVVVAVIVGAVSFGWWAADRIDSASVDQQRRALSIGLQEVADRIPVEQDSSAVWDDAVLNVRADNDAWLAENLAEWVSEYFGHDEVYILDSTDRATRSVLAGQHVADGQYEERREAIEPLVKDLRRQMAAASDGEADSTEHIKGLGALDDIAFANGDVGIVSVRPIIPSTPRLTQAAGTEYLLISVRLFDQALADDISREYALSDLTFKATATTGNDRASSPVLDRAGRIQGFFTWIPNRPAMALIGSLEPALIGTAVLVLGALGFFAWRLRRTSELLVESEGNAAFLAFHDALTRLPNRALFTDRLSQAIAGWRHSGEKFALHVVDLDRFKRVNDSLGHPAGDELMRQVAQRLSKLINEVDTAARIGGDEFAVVQRNIRDVAEAIGLSQRIVAAME